MQRPNASSYPSNTGWAYSLPGGGMLIAEDRADLVRKLSEHNARVGAPAGSEADVIDAAICAGNPGICKEDGVGAPAAAREYNPDSLRARVQGKLGESVRLAATGRLPRVSADVARRRADICRACPRNTAIPRCESCDHSMAESRAFVVKLGPDFDRSRLEFCASYATDLHVSCSLDLPTAHSDGLPAPASCWRQSA